MAVVRDLIATVNRLTQAGSSGAVVKPATASVAHAADPDRYAGAGIEPSLEDLLEEPIVQLVMRADRLEPADIRRLFHGAHRPPPMSAGATAARMP